MNILFLFLFFFSRSSPQSYSLILHRLYFSRCRYEHKCACYWWWMKPNFDILLTVHLSIFVLVINQLVAQKFCFTISLFHASTCFKHHVLIIRRSKFYCTASRFDDTKGCIIQFWPPDDEHMVIETYRGMK